MAVSAKNSALDISKSMFKDKEKISAEKNKTRKNRRVKEIAFLTCVLAYPVLQFIVFYIGVNLNSILLAFKKLNPETVNFYYVGFENFKEFFNDMRTSSILSGSFKNSLTAYLCTMLIGFPLNIMFSFFLYKKVPLSGIFKVVLFLPQIISSIVMTIMFKFFVGRALPSLFAQLNIAGFPMFLQNPDTVFGTMVFYSIWAGFGSAIIIYSSSMSGISESLVEYGKLEGITMFKEFRHITLPLIFPTVTTFIVISVASFFTNQVSVYNFFRETASYNLYTLGYYLFVKIIGENARLADYPYAAAAGLMFTFCAVPVTLLVKRLLEKFGPSVD